MTISYRLYEQACQTIPGGVNSPVRAFGAVEDTPPFIARAEGARLWDVDGREYVDYVGSWGPMILGHARLEVVEAVKMAAQLGLSFGAPTKAEVDLAREIVLRVPSVEQVRLVNSGTEAAMSAIRLARGFTGRRKILKFEGCYHGHADCLLVKAGSGAATLGIPDSAGVTPGAAEDTLVATYNSAESVREIVEKAGDDLACIIVEPVAGNMGCIPPGKDFLQSLREITAASGALLVFDEVMTGFRVARGGAEELYGIRPDLSVMGKVLGGGLPLAAYGGRRDIMQCVAPMGSVYQAGTLSGNPLATAAGLAQLSLLDEDAYAYLESMSGDMENALREAGQKAGVELCVQRIGSMLTVFFTRGPVTNYTEAAQCDRRLFARFHGLMLESGVYLPPSQFESWFVSTAHTRAEVDITMDAASRALSQLKDIPSC
ncbi:MAG: glutamate-1-semialdehyde 2,1-aminomutase [Armatimonadota bacterium]